jgi:hypothetical protein
VKKKIAETERDFWRNTLEINSANRESDALRGDMAVSVQRREGLIEKELEVYKDTQRFRNYFEREVEKDRELGEERRARLHNRSQEARLAQSQEEKNLQNELRNYENYIRKREEHFQRIKKVSNCVQPNEMLSYYNYLGETRINL